MVKTNGRLVRRSVFWIVLLGSIVVLAGLFFYYSGYRFDPATGRVIQLGSITANINPSGSHIYLNGQLLQQTTPAIINAIKPGEYTISFAQDGFSSLDFPITVQSKSTTLISQAFLPQISNSQAVVELPPTHPFTPQQLSDLQLIQDWPIWEVTGEHPTAVISGPDRNLSLVDHGVVTPIANQVTAMDNNPSLHQLIYTQKGTAWMSFTNFDPMRSFIISRQSIVFTDCLLVPGMQAILLADATTIQLVEIGPEQTVSIIQLVSGEQIKNIDVDVTGKILYYNDGDQWYTQALQAN